MDRHLPPADLFTARGRGQRPSTRPSSPIVRGVEECSPAWSQGDGADRNRHGCRLDGTQNRPLFTLRKRARLGSPVVSGWGARLDEHVRGAAETVSDQSTIVNGIFIWKLIFYGYGQIALERAVNVVWKRRLWASAKTKTNEERDVDWRRSQLQLHTRKLGYGADGNNHTFRTRRTHRDLSTQF